MADLEKRIDAVLGTGATSKSKLKTETNTPAMGKRIMRAFNERFVGPESRHHRGPWPRLHHYSANFEHGQWWVTDLYNGAQWSVVDAEGGSAIDGFDFEQVTEGNE